MAFMGMSFDLSAMGLTADVISSMGDGLWDQMKGGMVAQMGGATLAKDEVTQFKGKSSLYVEIDGTKFNCRHNIKAKKHMVMCFLLVLYYIKYCIFLVIQHQKKKTELLSLIV